MSVSPDDLGRGLPHPDDDVLGVVPLPAREPAPAGRRRVARAGTVALVTTGAALTAGVAVAVPAVRDTVTERVTAALGGAASSATSSPPTTAPAPARPSPAARASAVGVLLERAEAHLDAGRLEPASAALTAALRRLEAVAPGDRDQTEVVRYGALRARLVAALETGSGPTPGASRSQGKRPASPPAAGTTREPGPPERRQPSRDASAKPRA